MYFHMLIVYANIAGVEAHWGDIGAAMYPVFLEASSVCGQLGACKKVEKCEKSIDYGTSLAMFQVNSLTLGLR